MIEIVDKVKCSACGACQQSCPKGCISFVEDSEGFLYPIVDKGRCIECGLCEDVCPIIVRGEPQRAKSYYAAINRNEESRRQSSSGGIFTLLAERVLSEGGVIFGACYNDVWEVEHRSTESIEGLAPLRVAKYMQSRIGDSFKSIKSLLRSGRSVLFVGTPCQAAGLRRYLNREYERLLIVDFICHGVPSPKVWRRYLDELLQSDVGSISHITFRDKDSSGTGNYNFKILGDENRRILYSEANNSNLYMRGMLMDLTLRPSCYRCHSKSGRSASDITIGDFWGAEALPAEMNDNRGVSLVMLNTKRGVESFPLEQTISKECTYAMCRRLNGGFKERISVHPRRKLLFDELSHAPSIITLLERALKESRVEYLWRKGGYIINYILRR